MRKRVYKPMLRKRRERKRHERNVSLLSMSSGKKEKRKREEKREEMRHIEREERQKGAVVHESAWQNEWTQHLVFPTDPAFSPACPSPSPLIPHGRLQESKAAYVAHGEAAMLYVALCSSLFHIWYFQWRCMVENVKLSRVRYRVYI